MEPDAFNTCKLARASFRPSASRAGRDARAWLQVDLRKYVLSNLHFGDLSFRFKGSGGELFWITVKFILLIYIFPCGSITIQVDTPSG